MVEEAMGGPCRRLRWGLEWGVGGLVGGGYLRRGRGGLLNEWLKSIPFQCVVVNIFGVFDCLAKASSEVEVDGRLN